MSAEAPKVAGYSEAVIESAARAGYEAVNARAVADYVRIGLENVGSVTPMETVPWAEQGSVEKQRNIDNARILAEDKDTTTWRAQVEKDFGPGMLDLFSDVVDAMLQAEDRRLEKLFTPTDEETVAPRKRGKPVVPPAVVTAFMSGLGRGLGQGFMEAFAASGAEKPANSDAADGEKKSKCEHVFHGSIVNAYLPCPGCGETNQ